MLLLNTLYAAVLTVACAQEFAFNLETIGKPQAVSGSRKLACDQTIYQGTIHKFPQSSFRSFMVIGEGRFRTFKQTTGDVKQSREELVYLAPPSSSSSTTEAPCESETTADEIVVEIVVEEDEQGVLETIVENVRNAFDEYVSPILGGNITSTTISDAARSALDWINNRIWGASKLARDVNKRMAVVKIDSDTGSAMIVKSSAVAVKVIRVDEIVYDATAQAVGATNGVDVGVFTFEVGDLILMARDQFFNSIGKEQLIKALSIENKSLANKADALVKAATKSPIEESFLLSIFE